VIASTPRFRTGPFLPGHAIALKNSLALPRTFWGREPDSTMRENVISSSRRCSLPGVEDLFCFQCTGEKGHLVGDAVFLEDVPHLPAGEGGVSDPLGGEDLFTLEVQD